MQQRSFLGEKKNAVAPNGEATVEKPTIGLVRRGTLSESPKQ
jgi:hypothetical protein